MRFEFLKALDLVGLSCLTHHYCNVEIWGGASGLGGGSMFKKVKVYARVLETRVAPLLEPQVQEDQGGFCPARRTLNQLFTLSRIFDGPWEFAQQVYLCFLDLENKLYPQRTL